MTDHRMAHTAPVDADYDAPLHELDRVMPSAYLPQMWTSPGERKAFAICLSVRGRPDAEVTVYRAVPIAVTTIRTGDWVTLTHEYAQEHLPHVYPPDYDPDIDYDPAEIAHVISRVVHADELYWDGNSINEFGWNETPEQRLA